MLLYLGLLIGAGLFVYTNVGSDFQDYISGRTSYAVGRKPITLKDIPTWTLCFKLRTHKGEIFESDNVNNVKKYSKKMSNKLINGRDLIQL